MRYALAFVALIASVSASPNATPTTPFVPHARDGALFYRDGYQSINPPAEAVKRSLNLNPAGNRRVGHFDTNAKRLAAGLPLKAPGRRYNGNRAHAPRQTSLPCTNGVVHVTYGTTNGYLSSQLNDFGEYHTTTSSACDASTLEVCVHVGTSTPSSITLRNPDYPTTPYLGAFVGYQSTSASLSTTSPSYIILAGTAQSSSPTGNTDNTYSEVVDLDAPAESDIWLIADDGTMTLSWTNEDGSDQVASVGYSGQDAFVGTADPADYTTTFGEFDVGVFNFVPSSSVSCAL